MRSVKGLAADERAVGVAAALAVASAIARLGQGQDDPEWREMATELSAVSSRHTAATALAVGRWWGESDTARRVQALLALAAETSPLDRILEEVEADDDIDRRHADRWP
jgi:hypothetical protein